MITERKILKSMFYVSSAPLFKIHPTAMSHNLNTKADRVRNSFESSNEKTHALNLPQ